MQQLTMVVVSPYVKVLQSLQPSMNLQARESTEGGGRTKVEDSKSEAEKHGSIGYILGVLYYLI